MVESSLYPSSQKADLSGFEAILVYTPVKFQDSLAYFKESLSQNANKQTKVKLILTLSDRAGATNINATAERLSSTCVEVH